jgi:hypothetical protein
MGKLRICNICHKEGGRSPRARRPLDPGAEGYLGVHWGTGETYQETVTVRLAQGE